MQKDSFLGALLATADGSWTLCHPEHGECYHSSAGARLEAEALYVRASGLADRLVVAGEHEPLSIADIGLGLGYNACATMAAWWQAARAAPLHLLSFEVNEALVLGLASGQAGWQAGWPDLWRSFGMALRPLGEQRWQASLAHPVSGAPLRWEIRLGDARTSLARLAPSHPWDYIWQDPFSPSKNPPLWAASWFTALAEHAAPGATLMTYSVARSVREALSAAGWRPDKIPTAGPKRAWLKATYLGRRLECEQPASTT